MIKKIIFLTLLILSPALVYADCYEGCMALQGCPASAKGLSCAEEKEECEESCQKKSAVEEDDDVLFTGIKVRQGNTTLMHGERIAAPLSAFEGGDLKPEDLAPFKKQIISSSGGTGSVAYSETSSKGSWFSGSRTEVNQNTNVQPGVTISRRKDPE